MNIAATLAFHIYNLLFLGVLIVIMTAIGMRLLGFFKARDFTTLERILVSLALGLGLVAYVIYAIGLVGQLYVWVVAILLLLAIFLLNKELQTIALWLRSFPALVRKTFGDAKKKPYYFLVALPFIVFGAWNLIGALSPEIEFDALWYHLTLPKIYIEDARIAYIPGDLLYYSVFPRLTEMIFTLGLILGNGILAKLFTFAFGVLWTLVIYVTGKRFFGTRVGIIAALITYTTYEVGWLSRTAYVDLAAAFFGAIATFVFAKWLLSKESSKYELLLAGVLTGLFLATKHWSLGILPAVGILILLKPIVVGSKEKLVKQITVSLIWFFVPIVLLMVPWYLDAYINTGNPVYPIGAIHDPEHWIRAYEPLVKAEGARDWILRVWPLDIIPYTWQYLISAISPLLVLLLAFIPFWKKVSKEARWLLLFGSLFYLGHTLVPTGYYRYSLPNVSMLIVLSGFIISSFFWKKAYTKWLIICVFSVSVLFNFYLLSKQNKVFLPVFTGTQTQEAFVQDKLATNAFTFTDRDGYFKEKFSDQDNGTVLTYGIHNLFYVNFPFIAAENERIDLAGVSSKSEMLDLLKENNIEYVLFKRFDVPVLWEGLGMPIPFEEFDSVFELEYTQEQDKVLLYKIVQE